MVRKFLFSFMLLVMVCAKAFSQCSGTVTITASPPPSGSNTYSPGQVVTFCVTVNGFTQLNSNWFHGLTLSFGPGWDVNSITVVSVSPPASGSGAWVYSPTGETSSYTGQFFGTGFYFNTTAGNSPSVAVDDGIPGNNFGDNCSGSCTWTFCFTITVSGTATNGTSASITALVTGDGTSGSWSSAGCNDAPTTVTTATVGAPVLAANSTHTDVTCSGSNDGTATANGISGNPPYTYSWNTIPVQNTATATGLGPGTYTCTVTDQSGATATTSQVVAQGQPLSIIDSIVNPSCNGMCDGAVITTIGGGATPYTYTWDAGAAPNASNDYAVCAGVVHLTVTDAGTCSLTATWTLTNPAPFSVVPVSQTNELCNGGSTATITVSTSGGHQAPNIVYQWSDNQTGPTAVGLSAGAISVNVTDSMGCTATAVFNVTEPTALTFNPATLLNPACAGSSTGGIIVDGAGATPPYTYAWTEQSNSATFSGRIIDGIPADTYVVTATDANGCTASTSYQLTDPPALVIDSLTHADGTCYGADNGSAHIYAHGGTGALAYHWSASSTNTTAAINSLAPGVISVTVTDANGCNASASASVTQPLQIFINEISRNNVACNTGSNGTITVAAGGGTGAFTYAWNDGIAGATDSLLAATTVAVTATDVNGCTATKSFTITQPTAVTASTSQHDALCFQGANGSAMVTGFGGVPPYIYKWSDQQSTPTAEWLLPGNYYVTITDVNGCTASASAVIGQPTEINTSTTTTPVKCPGSKDGTISVTVTGGTSPYNYSATKDNTNFTYATGTVILGLDTGIYQVIVSDSNGCTKVTNAYVPNATPDQFTTSTDSTTCYGPAYNNGAAHVIALSTQNGPYQFSIDNGLMQDTGYFDGLSAGHHFITYISANGCTDTIPVVVFEPLPVIARVTPDTVVLPLGESQQVKVDYLNAFNPTYLWTPSLGLNCTDCNNPVVSTYTPGEYTVAVMMENKGSICYGYATLTVQVLAAPPVFVPNAFSPNGDGNNDVFLIYGETIKTVNLKVFNRWGELVYQTESPMEGWDGNYKGAQQLPGVYTWVADVVHLDDTRTHKTGSVTLVR